MINITYAELDQILNELDMGITILNDTVYLSMPDKKCLYMGIILGLM